MTGAELPASAPPWRSSTVFDAARLVDALKTVGPPSLFGLRLWVSVCFALYVAFLAMSRALTQHASYFDAGAPA